MKKRLKTIRAIAFEADPQIFALFANKPQISQSGVEYFHKAVSRRTGENEFLVQKSINKKDVGARSNNSLLARTEPGVEYEVVKVPSTTLSDFLSDNDLTGRKYSAWIDVEGASEDVLRGADGELQNCLSILIEVEQYPFWKGQWLFQDVSDYLVSRNFIPIARDFEYPKQFNVVYLQKGYLRNDDIMDVLTGYFSAAGHPQEA